MPSVSAIQGASCKSIRPSGNLTGSRQSSSRFSEVLATERNGVTEEKYCAENQPAKKIFDRIGAGRKKLDWIIAQANSGRSFQPRELLAMQAEVYRIGEEIALVNKVVEAGVSSVKRMWSMQV
jgi:hypothetical protein